jgi:hypothetical protein
MIRSGNPALRKKTFENLTTTSDEVMTLDGAVNKTVISMGILLTAPSRVITSSDVVVKFSKVFFLSAGFPDLIIVLGLI